MHLVPNHPHELGASGLPGCALTQPASPPAARAAACLPACSQGSKRLMQSDEGREELRQGSFDLDKTTERVLEVRRSSGGQPTGNRDEHLQALCLYDCGAFLLERLHAQRVCWPACCGAQEGKKDASPEARERAEDEDVQEAVKSRVVSGSQTT